MFIEDSYGWVDDFRASPGKCGSEISRRIYLHSLVSQGISLRQIKKMGFSKEMVADMNKQLVHEEYGPKMGDLVAIKFESEHHPEGLDVGIVVDTNPPPPFESIHRFWVSVQWMSGSRTTEDVSSLKVLADV